MVTLTANRSIVLVHPHAEKLEHVFQRFLQEAEGKLLETDAQAAVEFYRKDWQLDAYPDWNDLLRNAVAPRAEAERVIAFVRELFDEFGYWMPASFYQSLLEPIGRNSIFEPVYLVFEHRLKNVARQHDASYHGLNVLKVNAVLQTIAAKQGLYFVHGCNCGCHFSDLGENSGPSFRLNSQAEFAETAWAFSLRVLNEYMLFAHNIAIRELIAC